MSVEDKTNAKGRPRSSQARQAIIRAFIEAIKAKGYNKVSIDGVAKQAGVSRSTIYRWYKDKSEIALDAATDYSMETMRYNLSGDFKSDFIDFLEQTFAVGNEIGTMYTVLMAESQANSEFAKKVWDKYSSLRREKLQGILLQKSGGSVHIAMPVLLDMVFGAIWYRLMSGHAPLDQDFIDGLYHSMDCLLAAQYTS